MEKLLFLSNQWGFSLDALFSDELVRKTAPEPFPVTGSITITSPNENTVVTCYKVTSTQRMKGGRNAPQYALFGVSNGAASFWGEPTTFLGWYADQESLAREVRAIQQAIRQGAAFYELRYSAKVSRTWRGFSVVDNAAEQHSKKDG